MHKEIKMVKDIIGWLIVLFVFLFGIASIYLQWHKGD
jgi:hypothetical protein